MKSMGFLQFFESFRGKIHKKSSIGNEEWIEFETATITSDYVLYNKLSCRQNEQYFYFSLTVKDTEVFPKLLF